MSWRFCGGIDFLKLIDRFILWDESGPETRFLRNHETRNLIPETSIQNPETQTSTLGHGTWGWAEVWGLQFWVLSSGSEVEASLGETQACLIEYID